MRLRLSLRQQILLVISAVVLGSTFTYHSVTTNYLIEDREAYSFDVVSTVSAAKVAEIEALMSAHADRALVLARLSDEDWRAVIDMDLSTLRVEVLDTAGKVVRAHDNARAQRFDAPIEVPRAARAAFAHIGEGALRLENLSSHDVPRVAIVVGLERGTIVSYLQPGTFMRATDSAREAFEIFVVDERGQVVIAANREMMSADLRSETIRDVAQDRSVTRTARTYARGGQKRIAALARVPGSELTVVVEAPQAIVDATLNRQRRRTFTLAAAILLFALAFALLLSRRLTRPITRLADAAAEIGGGRLDVRVDVRGGRELSGLGDAFNTMSTELAARDAHLRDAHLQLQHRDRMALMGTMAAGVGHEINNPLTFIVANQRSLSEELDKMRARYPSDTGVVDALQLCADIGIGSSRVRDIVQDLRVFSRSGDATLSAVDVRQTLDLALKMARHEVDGRCIVERAYADVRPVIANDGRLGQVFMNLIVNAAHAMPTAREVSKNRIRFSVSEAEGEVNITIEDNAGGIPDDVRDKIFDPFFTTKAEGKGTGLGLAISKQIVETLDGTLELHTEVGRGTRFVVRLPAADAPALTQEETKGPAPRRTSARVLVIDDEPAMGRIFKRQLRKHEVTFASTTEQIARAVDDSGTFDVIFCDLALGGTNGAEVFAEVKARAPAACARMVFVTGGATTESLREFLRGQAVLHKPFSRDDLEAHLLRLTSDRPRDAKAHLG